MSARRYILTGLAAIYFGALIGLAFVPSAVPGGAPWGLKFVAFALVGVLLVLLLGRRRWWAALAFAVLGSAWIEAAQMVWMPAGYAAMADFAWEASGALLGVAITALVLSPRLHSMRAHGSPRMLPQAGRREIPQD